jgi:hypothetical protein
MLLTLLSFWPKKDAIITPTLGQNNIKTGLNHTCCAVSQEFVLKNKKPVMVEWMDIGPPEPDS